MLCPVLERIQEFFRDSYHSPCKHLPEEHDRNGEVPLSSSCSCSRSRSCQAPVFKHCVSGTLYLNPDFRDAVDWASRKLKVSPLAVVLVFECPSTPSAVHTLGNTCDLFTQPDLWEQVVRTCRSQDDQAPDFDGFD